MRNLRHGKVKVTIWKCYKEDLTIEIDSKTPTDLMEKREIGEQTFFAELLI